MCINDAEVRAAIHISLYLRTMLILALACTTRTKQATCIIRRSHILDTCLDRIIVGLVQDSIY